MAWVQMPAQYDESTGQTTPGVWRNTAGDDYDPAAYMTDAQYQRQVASRNATPTGLDKYFVAGAGDTAYNQNPAQGDPFAPSFEVGPSPIRPASEAILQGGVLNVINDAMRLGGTPSGVAGILDSLASSGYLSQFSDYTPELGNQVGELIAQGQKTSDGGPGGMLKGAGIHLGNLAGEMLNPFSTPALTGGFGGESSDFLGRPSDATYQEQGSQGVDVPASQMLNNFGAMIGMSAVGAGLANAAGMAGTAPTESAASGGTSGGAAAPEGVTYGTAAGDTATIYGTGAPTGGGSPGIAAGTAGGGTAAADALATEPYGGFDSAAIEGADFTAAGAEGAGLSLGGAGAGALGGTSALSAAGGSSAASGSGGGGGSGGGSATGGGGLGGGSWLTSDDEWLKMLMRGAPGLLGALGSASQAEDFEDLANQYSNMGAPYRSKLQELYGNPQAFLNSPEVRVPIQQGTDMLARSLSVKGNPAGSGNALQELQNYTSNQLFSMLGQEKDRLGGFGGLTQYNQAAPNMAQNALAAQGNIYGDLGGAAADIFNPPKRYTLQDLMRSMG